MNRSLPIFCIGTQIRFQFFRPTVFVLVASVAVGLSICLISAGQVDADDWARFRGPNGAGVSKTAAPVKWSPTKNLKWKTTLPGAGVSSPVVVGNKIIVTCYSGYGVGNDNGNIEDLKRHVVCVDRGNGSILWNKTVDAVMPEDVYRGMGVPQHGYASHTPVSDGKNVYAFLGKSGVVAYDLEGNQLWHQSVGTGSDERNWGSASSPVLFEDLVIVPAICESTSLIALNKKTGKQVWKEEADGLRSCWGTPLIVDVGDGRSDLVLGVVGEIWGLNPKNGKMRWLTTGIAGDSFYTSVFFNQGKIYASASGRSGGSSVAVKIGGKGDVTETHVDWSSPDAAGYGSPAVANDTMFLFSRGFVTRINANTGEQIKKERLPPAAAAPPSQGGSRRGFGGMGNSDYSSPVVAGDKLYYVRKSGETLVFTIDADFEQVASNRVTEEDEEFSATPAICDGQIILRSNKSLYCVEAK